LQIKYRSANEAKRLEIQDQWNLLVVKGEALQDRLIASAEKAYTLAPDEDPELPAFLFRLLVGWSQEDNYEPADRIAKLLIKNHYKQSHLPMLAGIAAFAVADFDSAEQYLNEAVKTTGEIKTDNNNLDSLIQAFLADPPLAGKDSDAKKPLSLRDYMKEGWAQEKQIRENETNADNLPRVLLKTTKGNIELELFENNAPNTVANFIYLVEKKFYNNVPFHRVLSGFMAQGGDPKGDGTGGPGYAIPCECYKSDYRHHFRGSLSMAHAGPNTGGSQFFLTFVPTVSLDGVHTVFGRVVSGMDVLAKLQRVDPESENTGRPDRIIEAQVLRKRSHEYFPKKVE
jgi:cyclophilin family peptidyl-prolyl cis-trans isomerase